MKKQLIAAFLGGIIGSMLIQQLERPAYAGVSDAAYRVAVALERIAYTLEHKK